MTRGVSLFLPLPPPSTPPPSLPNSPQVETEEPRLQLLYSNLQQEDITGQDLWDMMDAGHLVEGFAVRSREWPVGAL